MHEFRRYCLQVFLVAGSLANPARAEEDLASIPSRDRTINNDEHQRYVLVGPARGSQPPAAGYGLVIVLPGGNGSAEFTPFVKRIFANAIPDGYLVAQPIAVQWTPRQKVVWPTEQSRVPQCKFTTEQFVDAIIDDVGGSHAIDPQRVFTLSWSSSGPACYAISMTSEKVKGSFVAMSVFNPRFLPTINKANGHAYYLYHSPQDRVCAFRFAEQAARDLEKAGAAVALTTYEGGHGWHGDVFGAIHDGIVWLERNAATTEKP